MAPSVTMRPVCGLCMSVGFLIGVITSILGPLRLLFRENLDQSLVNHNLGSSSCLVVSAPSEAAIPHIALAPTYGVRSLFIRIFPTNVNGVRDCSYL